MAGEYSGSYETGDPNKSDEQIAVEAALCYGLMRANYTASDISRRTGLSIRTVYRRLDTLILAQGNPPKTVMRAVEGDRVDDLARAVDQALYGSARPDVENLGDRPISPDLSPQDVASLVRAGLAARARRAALLGLDQTTDETNDEPLDPTAEPEEWELVAQEHRDEQAERVARGEFD